MKREKRQMLLIYTIIFIIIVLIILLTKEVMSTVKKEKPKKEDNRTVQKVDTNPYPNVNKECTFDVKLGEYQALTSPGCEGGYTRYNITDIVVNETPMDVSVIYSDKSQVKTGLFINDKKVKSGLDSITNLNFGIFDSKLFVLDKTNNEANVLAFNNIGKKVYNLSDVLEKEKVKDLSTGETVISTKNLNSSTFGFAEGSFEFDSVSSKCENSDKLKGSHYKVVYKGEKFEVPEFVSLNNC